MTKLNITEAIKVSGVSRQTFYKNYITLGKISVELDSLNRKVIDVSELRRVFGNVDLSLLEKTNEDGHRRIIQPDIPSLESKIKELETELKLQRELNEYAKEQIRRSEVRETDLHRHIDELIKNRQPGQKQISWFDRLFGK